MTICGEKFGRLVREKRGIEGLSQKDLSVNAFGHSGNTALVSRLESGRVKRPHQKTCDLLCVALGLTAQDLEACQEEGALTQSGAGLSLSSNWAEGEQIELFQCLDGAYGPPAETAMHLVHQWLVIPPPQTVELAHGRRINEVTVAKIEHRADQLRHLDDFVGGRDLWHLVVRELKATAQVLREAAYSNLLGQRMLIAVADLCQLAGWVASDAEEHSAADHFFRVGIKAAHAADDRPVAANLISTLAYFQSNSGALEDGILIAESALSGASGHLSATTQSLLYERAAWAYACAGRKRESEHALAAAEAYFERQNTDNDPSWVYWLDEDEVEIMHARCRVKLGEPERAIDLLTAIVDRYDPSRAREAALYTSWLSEAHMRADDIEHAARYAMRAVDIMAKTSSARSEERLRALCGYFTEYRDLGPVKDLFDKAHDLGQGASFLV